MEDHHVAKKQKGLPQTRKISKKMAISRLHLIGYWCIDIKDGADRKWLQYSNGTDRGKIRVWGDGVIEFDVVLMESRR